MNRPTARCFATVALLILWPRGSAADGPTIAVYFSPKGGAAAAVAEKIDAARSRVLVQAYSISEARVTMAILRAKNRGLDVQVIVDPTQHSNLYSTAPTLHAKGVPVHTDAAHQLQHNKTMVIDDTIVITGSANFTRSGESDNAENTLIITDPATNAIYAANWQEHRSHCKAYVVHKRNRMDATNFPPAPSPSPNSPATKEP